MEKPVSRPDRQHGQRRTPPLKEALRAAALSAGLIASSQHQANAGFLTKNYYTQLAVYFSNPKFTTNAIEADMTAIQTDGVRWAAYELNGRTNEGKSGENAFYQMGLMNINGKFSMLYQVWMGNISILPALQQPDPDYQSDGCPSFGGETSAATAGQEEIHGKVSPGDRIRARLAIEGKEVHLTLRDLDSGAEAHKDVEAVGERFVGGKGECGQATGLAAEFVVMSFGVAGAKPPEVKAQSFEMRSGLLPTDGMKVWEAYYDRSGNHYYREEPYPGFKNDTPYHIELTPGAFSISMNSKKQPEIANHPIVSSLQRP